jgi:hypothetical protein
MGLRPSILSERGWFIFVRDAGIVLNDSRSGLRVTVAVPNGNELTYAGRRAYHDFW